MFSATIIQVGLGIVFIILKSPLYELVFHHYIRPEGRNQQAVFHDCYISSYIPYFASSKICELEGGQVTNDMYIWEAKSFAKKTFLNDKADSDKIMRDWLKWSGKFYQGCSYQQEKEKHSWWLIKFINSYRYVSIAKLPYRLELWMFNYQLCKTQIIYLLLLFNGWRSRNFTQQALSSLIGQ